MGGAPGSSYARNTARLRPAKWVHMPRAEWMPRVRPWQKEPFMSPKIFLSVMVLLIVAGFVVLDQIGDAVRNDARLPAAGARQDQHGSLGGFDSLALLRVQLVKKRQNRSGSGVVLQFYVTRTVGGGRGEISPVTPCAVEGP